MGNKIEKWIPDFLYWAKGYSQSFLIKKPPENYLKNKAKSPVILIPGIFGKWQLLKHIGDRIAESGHPVYVLEQLGFNTKEISAAAKAIRALIAAKNLENVVIIAHSKGGLIGKYLLLFLNEDQRIKKVIAIATPFHGSELAYFFPLQSTKELVPESEKIQILKKQTRENSKIVSIYSTKDELIKPESSCKLENAKNIQVDARGHHKILFDRAVIRLVLNELG